MAVVVKCKLVTECMYTHIILFLFPGLYRYTSNLCRLHKAIPQQRVPIPPEVTCINSPLVPRLPHWVHGLRHHPDREFANCITDGIQFGFRLGFDYSSPLRPAQRNMPSAAAHPEVISRYVENEISGGRIFGPFPKGEIPKLQINRMGVIPKGHTPGKWRMITDLSFPEGASVNDGIDPQLCSLQYTSVERVARAAQSLGKGALLAKLDVKAAYRLIPVHPDDRWLLGFEWQGSHYVDGMLPFGLRSAPIIFTAVADAMEWMFRQHGVSTIDHYLDDFIIIGPPRSRVCGHALDLILGMCEDLGVPLALDKLEGPSDCIIFLGIEINTAAGILRLPADKLAHLRTVLQQWSSRRACERRELESLIGTLQHACRVIKPGRSFLRQMICLLRIPRRPHHHVRLNKHFRSDLQWWRVFASYWNGVAVFPLSAPPSFDITSDASGQWGCGAWSLTSWFQFQWPPTASQHHISFLELFAVLLACAVWGNRWHGSRVRCLCDNQAAVHTIASRSSRDPTLMHLLRCLFFMEAWFQFELVAVHIPGTLNTRADDLSRDRLSSFFLKAPEMESEPTAIPPLLPTLLLGMGDWTSPLWTKQFVSTVTGV